MLNNSVGGKKLLKNKQSSLSSRGKSSKKGEGNVEKSLLYQCLDHLSFSKPNGKKFSAIIDQTIYQLTGKSSPVAANSCIKTFGICLFVYEESCRSNWAGVLNPLWALHLPHHDSSGGKRSLILCPVFEFTTARW